MKKSSIGIRLLLLVPLLMIGFALQAKAQDTAVLISDKDDYAPGEIAILSGDGFMPGEAIDLSIAISDPETDLFIGDYQWTDVVADQFGSFDVEYLVPIEAAGMNLTATALGLDSGLVAAVTFTDSHLTLDAASISASGNILSISATIGTSGLGTPIPTSVTAIVGGGVVDLSVSLTHTSTVGTTTIWTGTQTAAYSTTYFIRHVHTQRPAHPGPGGGGGNKNFNNVDIGSATTGPAPSSNTEPEITCLDPTAALGSIAGCLTGAGFGKTIDVVYAFAAPNVTATFWDGTTNLGTVNVATVTDSDNDPLTVTLNPLSSTVSLVGPGPASANVSVNIHANDGNGGTDEDDCATTVNASITYVFGGFRPPLAKTSTTVVKKGSTVPVKFRLYDCDGNEICDALSDIGHTIKVVWNQGSVPAGDPDINDSGSSNSNGVNFRYSGVCGVDGNWIYNLSTKTGYAVGHTYKITACLDDGTSHDVFISIK